LLSLHTHTVKNINFLSQLLASICSQVELVLLQHTLLISLLTNVCMVSYPFSLFMFFYLHVAFCISCIWGVEFCCKSKPILTKVVTFMSETSYFLLVFVRHYEVPLLCCSILWSISGIGFVAFL